MRRQLLAALPLAIAAALSACSSEKGITVSGDSVADSVAGALEEEFGERPEVDCGGDDDIAVTSGKLVECTVVDPATGSEYDATAKLEVIGDYAGWRVRVEMAETPR
jgi:hypothetical protein